MPLDFGWVLTPTAQTPEAAASLHEDNRRFLAALHPPFTTVWVEDHFQWGDAALLECWTLLTWVAAQFPGLQLGTLTLGQSYRNPALVAKMAATLQWLSGGRLILGIGAGWKEDEYRAYGYPYPRAGERIAGLREAAEIIRRMWRESPASFAGRQYYIAEARCEPRPTPPPPLLIGGGGERKTLRVVAEAADWWNLGFTTLETYRAKVETLRGHCAAVGRDPGEIKLTYYGHVSLSRDPAQVLPADVPGNRSPMHRIAGTPDRVAEELGGFAALGVEHLQLKFLDFPSLEGYELFIDEVVPRLGGAVDRRPVSEGPVQTLDVGGGPAE